MMKIINYFLDRLVQENIFISRDNFRDVSNHITVNKQIPQIIDPIKTSINQGRFTHFDIDKEHKLNGALIDLNPKYEIIGIITLADYYFSQISKPKFLNGERYFINQPIKTSYIQSESVREKPEQIGIAYLGIMNHINGEYNVVPLSAIINQTILDQIREVRPDSLITKN